VSAWDAKVLAVRDHVRQNLRDDLHLDELGDVAGASRFHFARIFKAVTGETLNQFVRRARLERATELMRTRPERLLLDIALSVGFKSASDFSRVFKQRYGLAPSAWDRRSPLTIQRIPDYDDGLAAARATCPPFTPVVRTHSAVRLATVRAHTAFFDQDELERAYRVLLGWLSAQSIDGASLPLVGMSWDQPEVTPLDKVCFDLGLPIPEDIAVHGPVAERRLPAHASVEVHVDGPLPHVALAWEHLYDRWLPRSDREPTDLPAMKRFVRQPAELGWGVFDLHCCVPLR